MSTPDPVAAFQSIIDRGGRFLPMRMITDNGKPRKVPVALTKGAKARWGWPEGETRGTDAERPIREVKQTKTGERVVRTDPYTAEEMVRWQEQAEQTGKPLFVGLLPSTVDGGLCVVDYDKGAGSALAWSDLMGVPLTVVTSTSGRGKHAWFRWPEAQDALPSDCRGRFPGLTEADETVEADLLFHDHLVSFRGAKEVVALADALAGSPEGSNRLRDDVVQVFRNCPCLDQPTALQKGLGELAAVRDKHARFPEAKRVIGATWQGSLRSAGPNGFLAQAYVECALLGTDASESSASDMRVMVRRFGAERRSSWEKENPFGHGEGRERLRKDQAARKVMPMSVLGLDAIVGDMGLQVGRERLGRRQFKMDFGRGRGWEPVSTSSVSMLCGEMAGRYAALKGKDKHPADWDLAQASVMGRLRYLCSLREIDVFGAYLESLDDVRYDAAAERRLLDIPGELWEFDNSPEAVGFAFRSLLCAAVARNLHPGTKYDLVPVLRGDQGIGKSSFVRALLPGGRRFAPLVGKCNLRLLGEMGGEKRLVENTIGKSICEIPELKGVKDVEAMKDFISREADEMRMSYDSDPIIMPRTTVMIATTNRGEPIQFDPSGNRRFIGLSVKGLNPALVADDPNPYRAIWRVLDNGLRDEWWGLAKAAVAAEDARLKEMGADPDNEGVGNRLLTPDTSMEAVLREESASFMSTSGSQDDLSRMIGGLRLADNPDRYAVEFLTRDVIGEVMGKCREGEKLHDKEAALIKSGMAALGWTYSDRHRFAWELPDGTQRHGQDRLFHPKSVPLPNSRLVFREAEVKAILTEALHGEPFTTASLEAVVGRFRSGAAGKEDNEPDIPF